MSSLWFVRRIGIRLPDSLWASIRTYGITSGLLATPRTIDISEVVRELIARGLSPDRTRDAGYRSGYREGRIAGYKEFMASVAMRGPR